MKEWMRKPVSILFLEIFSKIFTVFLNFFKNEQKFSVLWYDALHNEEKV